MNIVADLQEKKFTGLQISNAASLPVNVWKNGEIVRFVEDVPAGMRILGENCKVIV